MADIREYKKMKEQKSNVVSGKSRFNVQPLPLHDEEDSLQDEKRRSEEAVSEEAYDGDEREYNNRLRRHRLRVTVLGIAVVIMGVCAAFYLFYSINNRTYSGYTIMNSVTRDDIQNAGYYAFGEGFVRCSNDGVSYFNRKGNSVWNQTYQMKSPQLKQCDGCIAVGDINGSSIYIFNEKGLLGSVDTSLSISQLEVGSQGLVAAVLEDSKSNYINMYNTVGEKIYSVKTTLSGDGYPLDISISKDGTKLIASYVYVSGESIKTNVVFYNFSDVGQNETERVVGGFNHYDSTIVPDVHFMTDNYAAAVGEDIISIYKIKEFPSLYKEIKLDSAIERVFFSDQYIGVLLNNKESGDNYRLVVYNTAANEVCSTTFNTTYGKMFFDKDTIILYNDKIFTLMNIKGKTLSTIESDLPIEEILTADGKGNYLLVNSTYVQEIRLK